MGGNAFEDRVWKVDEAGLGRRECQEAADDGGREWKAIRQLG